LEAEARGGAPAHPADQDLHFLATCFPKRAADARPAFYYAKAPTRQAGVVAALNAIGFHVVDVNVTLSCAPQVLANPVCHNGLTVREAEAEDDAAILAIAGSCFRYSRFHLDPAIPLERAHAVKRAWIQSYLEGRRGEQLLVAVAEGRPVGFLAVLERMQHAKTCRVIDLVGVDDAYQRCGIGRALVNAFLVECTRRGTAAWVGTQAANIPSLRLYESLGFRVSDTAYVLHAHVGRSGLGEGRLRP
jgi:ribosomal protein S18 acetylase RimI-like enzyme